MGTLTINGHKIRVDDSFAKLSPADQEKTVNEIAAQMQQSEPAASGPPGAPGSREYAAWAAQQARAGKTLPQVSQMPPQPSSDLTATSAAIPATMQGITGAIPGLNQAADALIAGGQTVGDMFTGQQPDFGAHYNAIQTRRGQYAQAAPIAQGLGDTVGAIGTLAALPESTAATFGGKVFDSALGMAGYEGAQALANGKRGKDALMQMGEGALGGAAGPVVGAGLGKIISPLTMSAERTAAVNVLKKEGVPLTSGQASGNKMLRYAESELGGGAAEAFFEKQNKAFTKAALSRAGISADAATPQVMDDAFTTIGQQFDGLAQRNALLPDAKLSQQLGGVIHDYNALTPPSQRAPIVNDILGDLVKAVQQNGGRVDGAAYQSLRSRLDKAARAIVARDPALSQALFDIRSALDANMERSIAQSNPADLGAWKGVRRQYANLLVLEKAAGGSGEKAGLGIITPAALRTAAANQNKRAFVRGTSDFTDLAKAGQATMLPMPESGTSYRLAARGISNLPSVIGGIAGSAAGLPGIAAGAVAGHLLPPLLGRAMLSGPGRALLTNQVANGPGGQAAKNLLNALVRGGTVAALAPTTGR
jgi:hypothetical protein